MTEKIIRPQTTDLASRQTAAALRAELIAAADAGNHVTVDFKGVRSVSESYGDELFGVLAADRGLEWLGKSVEILADREVLASIAGAVRYRLHAVGQINVDDKIKTLAAARRARRAA